MAVKDSIGGWKDNAHLFKTPRACSSIKSFFGDNWPRIAALVGHPSSCPIPRVWKFFLYFKITRYT